MGNLITPKKCINIKLNLVYYCLLLCAIEVNIDVTKTVFIYLFVFFVLASTDCGTWNCIDVIERSD